MSKNPKRAVTMPNGMRVDAAALAVWAERLAAVNDEIAEVVAEESWKQPIGAGTTVDGVTWFGVKESTDGR